MNRLDIVRSTKKYMSGLLFCIKRIGDKRVSLEIVKPTPDKNGFVTKYFKTGKTESICFYKERTMTREFFNKSLNIFCPHTDSIHDTYACYYRCFFSPRSYKF